MEDDTTYEDLHGQDWNEHNAYQDRDDSEEQDAQLDDADEPQDAGNGASKQADARTRPPEIIQQEIESGALFVVNHSGGKDSQAMLIHVLQYVPAAQVLVVHATLGESEWPGALEHAQHQAKAAGVPFIVVEAGKTFLSMVAGRFENRPEVPSWPSASTRQCTSDLKRGPITREVRRYAKARGITRIVNCMGMRAAESSARAKKAPWVILILT